MQVLTNTTGMQAALTFSTDKYGNEYALAVLKGTFKTDTQAELTLADEQRPLVFADDHYGDPEHTCIRYESDFAPHKPFSEVIVVGMACSPAGRPVQQLPVRLELGERRKDALVVGDRRWVRRLGSVHLSGPETFVSIPLTWERAFGGCDDSRGPANVQVETRNLHGVGFHPSRNASELDGLPLPNIERPGQPLRAPNARLDPIGFGVLGRSYAQRAAFAGTYDEHWKAEVFPFLPHDFEDRYFMSTSTDQWYPAFQGKEVVSCYNMSHAGPVHYRLPATPMRFRFELTDREEEISTMYDTAIVEPHIGRAMLVWRARVRISKKPLRFAGVHIGAEPARGSVSCASSNKPRFASLGAAVAALRKRRNI